MMLQVSYRRVSQGMLHTDKAMFALLLLRVYLTACTNEPPYDAQFDHLLRNSEMLAADASKATRDTVASTSIAGLNEKHILSLATLAELKHGFANCVKTAGALGGMDRFVTEDKPETEVPVLWSDDTELSKLKTFNILT